MDNRRPLGRLWTMEELHVFHGQYTSRSSMYNRGTLCRLWTLERRPPALLWTIDDLYVIHGQVIYGPGLL